VAAIGRFCDGWNQRCQPLRWTKDADQILAKLHRRRAHADGRNGNAWRDA